MGNLGLMLPRLKPTARKQFAPQLPGVGVHGMRHPGVHTLTHGGAVLLALAPGLAHGAQPFGKSAYIGNWQAPAPRAEHVAQPLGWLCGGCNAGFLGMQPQAALRHVLADLPVAAFFDRTLLAQTSQAAALFVKGELV